MNTNKEHEILSKTNLDDSSFINESNSEEVIKLLSETSKKVIECLMIKRNQAIINSEIWVDNLWLDFPLENFPENWSIEELDKSLDLILSNILPNYSSPNYFWHMLTSLNSWSLLASNLANIFNQNIIAQEVWPTFTQIENVVIWYISELIWYDKLKSWWTITSWWTNANHTALLVARNKILPWVSENWLTDSLEKYNLLNGTNYKKVVMLYWADSHYSIEKLCWYIWIWTKNSKTIPYKDWKSELDIEKMEEIIEDCEKNNILILWVVITAWTTEKWYVHNIDEVSLVTNKWQNWRSIHLHIDAAHGWWFLVDPIIKDKLFNWISEADSVTIDGHKMFFTNYSCGWIIFKDKNDMEYIKHSADYVIPELTNHDNHWAYTLEWSRWASWVYQLYINIKTMWREGFIKSIRRLIDNKKYLESRLNKFKDHFEILNSWSDLNVLCFRINLEWKSDDELNLLNDSVKNELFKNWKYYVSSTTINWFKAFRSVFMNPLNIEENIDEFISYLFSLIEKYKLT